MAHPRLALLGDVFAIPAGVPLAEVFSIGDVVIMLGVVYTAYRICGTRWWNPWDAATHGYGYRLARHLSRGPINRLRMILAESPRTSTPVEGPVEGRHKASQGAMTPVEGKHGREDCGA